MRSILIVEDSVDVREMYTNYLSKQGFEVSEAGEGQEALRKVSQAKPDLILMDLSLPGMDGFAAIRALKANENTKLIPVIVFTAYSTQGAAMVVEAQCEGFLLKPCSPASLVTEIERVLQRSGKSLKSV